MELSGRAEAPDWSRGRTLPFRAHGETTDSHGPLQRLLEVTLTDHHCARAVQAPQANEGFPVKRAPEATNKAVPRLARSATGATAA